MLYEIQGTGAKPAAAADSVTPAVNTAAVITYGAVAGLSHVISLLAWSYNAAPTGGNLKVEDGSGNIIFQTAITAAGPGFIPFDRPIKGTANTALIITLAAGSGSVVGNINARHWTE